MLRCVMTMNVTTTAAVMAPKVLRLYSVQRVGDAGAIHDVLNLRKDTRSRDEASDGAVDLRARGVRREGVRWGAGDLGGRGPGDVG